ncbi:hypothetical protein IWX46DRAFT_193530 [Phyllosticta citricarpa]|uniref:Uncharacterized protein n=1 Tax=Phyllosticta citricarpa TaxID=55181 RepID=A0ABR1M090_9PEZI
MHSADVLGLRLHRSAEQCQKPFLCLNSQHRPWLSHALLTLDTISIHGRLAEPPSQWLPSDTDMRLRIQLQEPKTQSLFQRPGPHALPCFGNSGPANQPSALWRLAICCTSPLLPLTQLALSPRAIPLCALSPTLTTDRHSVCLVKRRCYRLSRRSEKKKREEYLTKKRPIPTLEFLVLRPSNSKQTRQTPNTCKIRQLWSKNTNESSAMSLGL